MTTLSGDAAEARLAAAWDAVFRADPASQAVIHILAPPTEYPSWLIGFPPFEAWVRNDGATDSEVWHAFADAAAQWPYIRNARRALAAGIPNIRIFVTERAQWESPPLWLRYLAAVHLPAIAALAGETFYRVWREDAREAGLPDRDYDVNLWGASGIMLTGYQDGDVDWRAFLADDGDQLRIRAERAFIASMHDLAATRGELVELPVGLQP
jgi:hypothetical protein